MSKITTDQLRALEKMVSDGIISYDKMIEILNNTLVNKSEFDKAVKETSDLHPYKNPGNRSTYWEYNQGWQDCCELISEKLKELIFKP